MTRILYARTGGVRLVVGVALLAVWLATATGQSSASGAALVPWVGAWSTSPISPGPLFGLIPFYSGTGGRTVRDVVRVTLAGSELRIHLTNEFGNRRAGFQDVRVAVSAGGPRVVTGTSRRVTFSGLTSVTVAAGHEVSSDPIQMTLRAGQELAISIYSRGPTGPTTTGGSLQHTNYLSGRGDVAGAASATSFPVSAKAWYWLSGVDVLPPSPSAGAVVALGDSITAGAESTPGANVDWVDLLANRLLRANRNLSVLNAGISGNNLHSDSPCFGQSGLRRLSRDALAQAGVRSVIVALGTNDLTQPTEPPSAPAYRCLTHRPISAAGMIALYKLLIRRVHARHLQIIGSTITPFGRYRYWTPALERARIRINSWILQSHAFDGVIDFAEAVADRGHPSWLSPRYDSGDGLHPNNGGHAAMARAVNLSQFSG